MSNSYIWPIDATTPGRSRPGSDGNEGLLRIPQNCMVGASSSDCLVSYPGHSIVVWEVLPLFRDAVGIFYSSSWLGCKLFVLDKNTFGVVIAMKRCSTLTISLEVVDHHQIQFSVIPCFFFLWGGGSDTSAGDTFGVFWAQWPGEKK